MRFEPSAYCCEKDNSSDKSLLPVKNREFPLPFRDENEETDEVIALVCALSVSYVNKELIDFIFSPRIVALVVRHRELAALSE
jgi:hypothetical protein